MNTIIQSTSQSVPPALPPPQRTAPTLAVQSTQPSAISRAVAEALIDSITKQQSKQESMIIPFLATGEECLAFYPAEKGIPMIGWIPFVRVLDTLTRKHMLLVITSHRLLILELNRFQTAVSSAAAAVPLAEIALIRPCTGVLTSSVRITFRSGQSIAFTDMLKSHAEKFARDFQISLANQNGGGAQPAFNITAASAKASYASPQSGGNGIVGIARLILRLFLGAFGFLTAIGGLANVAEAKWGAAIFGVGIATVCLYAAFIGLKRPKLAESDRAIVVGGAA